MRLLGDHHADRIHGTLTVALSDGREGAMDIDIDVSDPRSFVEVRSHYDDEDRVTNPLRVSRLVAQTLSIHWPAPSQPLQSEEPQPPLVIRVPTP